MDWIVLSGLSLTLIGTLNDEPLLIILSIVLWLGIEFGSWGIVDVFMRVASLAYSVCDRPQTKSQRREDVAYLQRFARNKKVAPGEFLVVHGASGIGKSCAIETALDGMRAVVFTYPIQSGTNSNDIVNIALSVVANTEQNVHFAASSILQWYKRVFKEAPVIVLRFAERFKDVQFSEIPEAARKISELGYRVIVDCSDGAYPFDKLTERYQAIFYEMQPMTNDVLTSIPEFLPMIEFLRKENLLNIVLSTCGGSPLPFFKLQRRFEDAHDDAAKRNSVRQLVREKIYGAIVCREKFIHNHPETRSILKKFKEGAHYIDNLELCQFQGPVDFKNVLRLVLKSTDCEY